MRCLDSVIEATNMNLMQLQEAVEDRRAWRALLHGVTRSWTRLNDKSRPKNGRTGAKILVRTPPPDWTCNNGLELKEAGFRLNIRKNFLSVRAVRQWK